MKFSLFCIKFRKKVKNCKQEGMARISRRKYHCALQSVLHFVEFLRNVLLFQHKMFFFLLRSEQRHNRITFPTQHEGNLE